MFEDILVSFAAAYCIFSLLRWLKERLLFPLPKGDNMTVSAVVEVRGNAPQLESTVRGLCHLRREGKLPAGIVVKDCGMDSETASVAEKLAREGGIKLID